MVYSLQYSLASDSYNLSTPSSALLPSILCGEGGASDTDASFLFEHCTDTFCLHFDQLCFHINHHLLFEGTFLIRPENHTNPWV